jgi:hypothetical protein
MMEKKNAPAVVVPEPVASEPIASEPVASEAIAAEPVASEGDASKCGASVNWTSLRADDHFTRSAPAYWRTRSTWTPTLL